MYVWVSATSRRDVTELQANGLRSHLWLVQACVTEHEASLNYLDVPRKVSRSSYKYIHIKSSVGICKGL